MPIRRTSSRETTTLCWEMPDDAWAHWAQGRGEKSVRDVILEGIDQIRKNPEAVIKRCKDVAQEAQGEQEASQSPKHKIKIQLPAGDWAEACQRVGRINGNSVRTGQLLAALILESKSWQQHGNAEAEEDAGWNEDSLIFSLASLTVTTTGLSLGREEKIIAWIVAVATVAGAIAAWYNAALELLDETELAMSTAAEVARRKPGESREFDGIEFVWVPAGEFRMGSVSPEASFEEKPVTRVRINRGFWLGKYEVTQGQWQAMMGSNPSVFDECGPNCPVESVSWDDAQGFIRRLNEMEGGNRYRLPTEAEWEYAARAGSRRDTPAGDLRILGRNNAPLLDGIAWYGGNSGVSYAGGYDCSGWDGKQYASSRCGPNPVGQKAPNVWGLHDLLGNVWEWVVDWYGDYPGGSVTDPQGPVSGSARVYRGCGWYDIAEYCRAPARSRSLPGNRYNNLGFRLLRTE